MMEFEIVAFTANGARLAKRILRLYPDSRAYAPPRYCGDGINLMKGSIYDWTSENFKKGKTLIFIGAAGVAVRAVAPFLKSKSQDAAVICVDELGKNVIPLIAGHIGGANNAARQLARSLGANAAITTATDLNGVFSIDSWAVQNNCAIADISVIKRVSSALLDGETVGLASEFPVEGPIPEGISYGAQAENGIEIAFKSKDAFPHTLHLIPRIIVAGIGCRKGVPADRLEDRLKAELSRLGLPVEAVGSIASIDKKAGEKGLTELCGRINAKFITFGADELMAAKGEFSKSERVMRVTGTDNVCERAVVCAGGEIILRKSPADGITIALGKLNWKVSFEEV